MKLANVEQKLKMARRGFSKFNLIPLGENGAVAGVCITFNDVTRYRKLEEEVEGAQVASETANEERQMANEELQSTNKS